MKIYFGVVFFCIQKVSSQTLSLLDYALKYQRLFSSCVSVGIIPTNKRKHFDMALRFVKLHFFRCKVNEIWIFLPPSMLKLIKKSVFLCLHELVLA